jgi:PiT family inorganic phosphate transporter
MDGLLLELAVGITLVFAFINGFDGGSVIATLVCSRAMRPRRALVLATIAEFIGPLVLGTAVARTMAGSILQPGLIDQLPAHDAYIMVIAAVGGAILWSMVTWLLRLPSSSSHALIGGLIGAGLIFMGTSAIQVHEVLRKVALPLFVSPFIGFVAGFFLFSLIRGLPTHAPRGVGSVFVMLQKPCMMFLAGTHGANDAQKSMGVIALVLAAGSAGTHPDFYLPQWAIVGCAAAIALGLFVGGWRIAKTVGFGICRMEPVHSFASQLSTTSVVLVASLAGGPVSTAQVMSSSVMGVGTARRMAAVRWTAAFNIGYAWMLTIPISAMISASICWCMTQVMHG